jgi:hypothetical protein
MNGTVLFTNIKTVQVVVSQDYYLQCTAGCMYVLRMYKRTAGALKAILSPFWHFKTVFPFKGTIKYSKFFNSIFYAYGRPMPQCEPLLDFQSRGPPPYLYVFSIFDAVQKMFSESYIFYFGF